MLVKYAQVEEILEIKTTRDRLTYDYTDAPGSSLAKFAKLENGHEKDGFLYVRARAISSRVNKNNDGWPSEELVDAHLTFVGRPTFVDHNNDDPKRTRGVIVDATCYQEDDKKSALDPYYSNAPENHKPPTWIELLIEVDAKTYPKLASHIRKGDIDAVSMGANIDRSVCSVCANEASTPDEYCSHIKQKGLTFEITSDTGEKVRKKAYEDCYGVNFFEISFVFDPADETALITDKTGKTAAPGTLDVEKYIQPAGTQPAGTDDRNFIPQADQVTAPERVDTLRNETRCPICRAADMQIDPDGIQRCPTCGHVQEPEPLNNPDLEQARDTDLRQDVTNPPTGEEPSVPAQGPDLQGVEISPMEPVRSFGATKEDIPDGVIDEMFTTILRTNSKVEADKILPARVARVETTLGTPYGMHRGVYKAVREAGLTAKVTYTAVTHDDNVTEIPGDNPMFDFFLMEESATNCRCHRQDVPVVIEAATDEELAQILELVKSADLPKRGAAPKDRKPILPQTTKPSDEPKNQTIVSDQHAPVEAKVEKQGAELLVELDGKKYRLEPHEEPTDEEKLEEDVEEDEDDKESKTADRRHIVRTETDADGVTRHEEIVEETDPVTGEQVEQPVEEEEEEYAYATVEERENLLMAAFTLADEYVELGLIDAHQKMAFIAELENESIEQLSSRKATIDSVKTAGLGKKTTSKIAGTGLRRVPRLTHTVPSSNGNGSIDNIPDEAIYLG